MKHPGWLWFFIVVADLILVFLTESTYDSGDSVVHYLYSRQALIYPKYLMHHWAKPLFVLLSSPFSYWGWIGMKLFNAICMLGASYYTYKLFQSYHIKGAMAVLFCFAAPHFFLVQSSGLTEPLFTVSLIAIVYYLRSDRFIIAMIVLSFLPFVRSEGWIIAPVVLFYLLITKRIKYTPFILVGTVIYGLVGLGYYDDFLWMFHQNPYSGTEDKYGSGFWLHFVNQLPYVIGYPLYFLVFIGIFDGFTRLMKGLMDPFELVIIFGITIAYFAAHSSFWALGIFHSFGLKRVLIVLIPLFAFIAYRGLDRVVCAFGFLSPIAVRNAILLSVIIFPFTGNKAGLNLPLSVQKEPLQRMIDDVREYTDSTFGDRRIYFGNWYVPMTYGKDIDNEKQAVAIDRLKYEPAMSGSIVIWDSYFSVSDKEVSADLLRSKPELDLVRRFECEDCKHPYTVEVYICD